MTAPDGTADRKAERRKQLHFWRRVTLAIAVIVPLVVLGTVITVMLNDDWRWWLFPRPGEALPSDWDAIAVLDIVFGGLFALAVIALMRNSWSDRLASPALRKGLVGGVLAYAITAATLGIVLWNNRSAFADGEEGVWPNDVIVGLANLRVGIGAAALLGLVAVWRLPPPGVPEPDDVHGRDERPPRLTDPEWPSVVWHGPDHRPEEANWDPVEKRLGIAVSGGGVRSASFALGVLQQLRIEKAIEKARYVTSVSGGSYITSAFTALNQHGKQHTGDVHRAVHGALPPEEPFAPNSAEEQQLRRSLRYLIGSTRRASAAIGRILLGLGLNLLIVYLLLVAFVRPVGWLIGTPLVQEGLRIDTPIVSEIFTTSDDPDLDEEPHATECQGSPAPSTTATIGRAISVGTGDDRRTAHEIDLEMTPLCVELRFQNNTRTTALVPFELQQPGLIDFSSTTAELLRQPRVALGPAFTDAADPELIADITPAQLASLASPTLALTDDAVGLPAAASDEQREDFMKIERAAGIETKRITELRGPVDVDRRHWVPAVISGALALLLATIRTVYRPDWYAKAERWARRFGAFAAGWALIFLVLPWLVAELPTRLSGLIDGDGTTGELGAPSWLPFDNNGLPPAIVFGLLAVTAVTRFLPLIKAAQPDPDTPRRRNTQALIAKLLTFVQALAVILILLTFIGGGALLELSAGAANGPEGTYPWMPASLVGAEPWWIPDLAMWLIVCVVALATTSVGESSAWSPAPIYKRSLSDAFHLGRDDDGKIRPRKYGPGSLWSELVPVDDEGRPSESAQPMARRVGYFDGQLGDGAELVFCAAANVVGEKKSPTGRRSVSFTASRSYIGGPEVGWMPMVDYRKHMGRRRAWDVNLPGLTAISGAAVSPAMGKLSLGRIAGRMLALLNVRLGAWLPHPQWVQAIHDEAEAQAVPIERDKGPATLVRKPDLRWEHSPGWPWYVRELAQRYRWDAPYLYVSDGGHWENLALVEALRRGCTTIICVSAAGDGPLSLNTFGEAVEIARTDLGVEIELDDIWDTRQQTSGSTAPALPSGRQYILNPGPTAELGRAAGVGFAFGTFRYPADENGVRVSGQLLLIDAAMVDNLPVDVHTYAEDHPEFPNVSTGDQLFSDRDFESYRVLGRELTKGAFATQGGRKLAHRIRQCDRTTT